MKKQASTALWAAGRISRTFLTRIPSLQEQLGPIGSTSLQLASRISNLLSAGRPTEDLNTFIPCGLVLLAAPESQLDRAVDRLLDSPVNWRGKAVLLCDPVLGSESLSRMAAQGAHVASLSCLEGADERVFVAEGARFAVRMARNLVEGPGVRLVTIDPGRKAVFNAGLCFATGLMLPLMAASVETLRSSGLDQVQALNIGERLFLRTVRTYLKGGRKGWEGPIARKQTHEVIRQIQALAHANPPMGDYYHRQAVLAATLLRQDPRWLTELDPSPRVKAATA